MQYEKRLAPFMEKKWLSIIAPFFESREGQEILNYLSERKKTVKILPEQKDMFNAFKYTGWDDVRVVILGGSPYSKIIHGNPESDGLAFSYTPKEESDLHLPESLRVIRNELERDVFNNELITMDTCLIRWAKQGVLLLNSALTTEQNANNMHVGIWKPFTDMILTKLNSYNQGLIFCLWGNTASEFKHHINTTKHYVFEAGHPYSEVAMNGEGRFSGCKHFSKINDILKNCNNDNIKW